METPTCLHSVKTLLQNNKTYTLILCLLIFLLPITGWIPMLLLWLFKLVSLFQRNRGNTSRFVYGLLLLAVSVLLLQNLLAFLLVFLAIL